MNEGTGVGVGDGDKVFVGTAVDVRTVCSVTIKSGVLDAVMSEEGAACPKKLHALKKMTDPKRIKREGFIFTAYREF